MYHKRKKMKHGGSHDGNAMARREAKMGGGKMMTERKDMGHGGRMQYNKGGSAQPMYGHGECPKASAN